MARYDQLSHIITMKRVEALVHKDAKLFRTTRGISEDFSKEHFDEISNYYKELGRQVDSEEIKRRINYRLNRICSKSKVVEKRSAGRENEWRSNTKESVQWRRDRRVRLEEERKSRIKKIKAEEKEIEETRKVMEDIISELGLKRGAYSYHDGDCYFSGRGLCMRLPVAMEILENALRYKKAHE